MSEKLLSSDSEESALNKAASGSPGARRLVAFLNPDAPIEALARAQHATDWAERAAIAINPNTPEVVLVRLAEDGITHVRALARENLAGRKA